MMIFWVLQGLMDIVVVSLAVSYLIQRRRLLELETELQAALERIEDTGSFAIPQKKIINTPLGSALSTLSERRAAPADSDNSTLSHAGRYALAQKLITEGHPLGEVAKRTGISQTELALLRKLSPNFVPKNYEAH
ncbi:MAG: hypothetical protein ABIR96_04370 [Bdellovibrionota bacterium]